ncbi:LLM class flavin-dependent oxidoreductase [Solicola gregarius]|uniref:LLM class flavin-dependent oxidoreductase n=1 Tax=Solicola gregarius TaxID=2908642 RepID=A0AA46YN13_9ACTN|nr:LLM class flavin-dependent oxidoreductase [Solicola gregarius]UYM07016.1 LLM class flavin-dependent oxidoreductase [Solicola gregarius]
MSIKFHWYLPTSGDGRTLVGGGHDGLRAGETRHESAAQFRPPTFDYLAQVARATDALGYEAVLTPTGTACEDAFVTAAALSRETERLKFLVAFRPGLLSPTLAAQMASTFQRISGGRLLLNVVTGGEAEEQRRFGDHLDKAERYARCDEFLSVVRGAWSNAPYDFAGEHYRIEAAGTRDRPDPVPGVYFGGSSAEAGPVAARHADVYLTWGERTEAVAQKIEWMRGLARTQGRTLRFGIRLHTLSRDTAEQAWAHAQGWLDRLDPADVEKAQAVLARSESVGQQRMRELHGGRSYASAHDLEIAPNLWAGVGLVRSGAGTALVGSHEEVAERIAEYHDLGIDEFIMSGYPQVEEAYWFAEGVMPLLRRRGILGTPQGDERVLATA